MRKPFVSQKQPRSPSAWAAGLFLAAAAAGASTITVNSSSREGK